MLHTHNRLQLPLKKKNPNSGQEEGINIVSICGIGIFWGYRELFVMCSINDTADPLLQCDYKTSRGDVMFLWSGAFKFTVL